MGKLLQIAIAVIFVSFVLGVLATTTYNSALDGATSNKTIFANYTFYNKQFNASSELGGNFTYNQTTNPATNLRLAANNIRTSIAKVTEGISTANIGEAFGYSVKASYEVLILIVSVFIETFNFVAGLGGILDLLPSPWDSLATLMSGLILVLVIVYLVMKIFSLQQKYDV